MTLTFKAKDGKSPVQQLKEAIQAEAEKIPLTVPFVVAGAKFSKTPELKNEVIIPTFEAKGATGNFSKVTESKTESTTEAAVKYSEKQLFALTKAEQVAVLNKLGVAKAPSTEKERVAKILQLQG